MSPHLSIWGKPMSESRPTYMSMPDIKAMSPVDLTVLASGVLAFIFSFFPYYGAHATGSVGGVRVASFGKNFTAWHSWSTLALLLILAGTIVAALAIFTVATVELPVGPRWIAAGLCSLGALIYLIRLFTLPHHHVNFGEGVSASEGVKWGGYLLLVVVLVNAVAAVLGALRSEEQVPWEMGRSAAPPADAPPGA